MSWEDLVFSLAGVIGAIALLPSIFSSHKPALATSLINGLIAIAIMAADYSLGLGWAGSVAILISVLWFVLAAQQWNLHHRKKKVA